MKFQKYLTLRPPKVSVNQKLTTGFVITFITLIIVFIVFPYKSRSQEANISMDDWQRKPTPATAYTHIPKKLGHYSIEDWQAVIDSTWGPGLPTAQKLLIFDEAWHRLNADYAAFQNLNVDWHALRQFYRTEIDSGVSRGRFSAIMNYLGLALMETHTNMYEDTVAFTPRDPGVPLFVFGSPGNTTHFGATLSPLPDSSSLVIKVLPNHPLGLVPGDVLLGYDGIPWKILYKEILAAQLPVSPTYVYTSTEDALNHIFLANSGMNWHLFDTLDVVKYSTGDTVHLLTAPLAGQTGFIWGNEQLPIPGVPWFNVNTGNIQFVSQLGDYVSWGIIDGTQVGYIYVGALTSDWQPNLSTEFFNAADSLMHHFDTDGLILDIRLNYGGMIETANLALSLLFNSRVASLGSDQRGPDTSNHFQMVPYTSPTIIPGDPETIYDRPIAVLTGPGTISMGEQLAYRMQLHPMSRQFGKPTAGAISYTSGSFPLGGYTNWHICYTLANCYPAGQPGNYLAHTGLLPDEEVWLTKDDVANGEEIPW